MRGTWLAALAGAAIGVVLGCVDFDLDSRRFRCDGQPEICDDGWLCGADGYCTPAGAIDASAAPDAPTGEICGNNLDDDGGGDIDCADEECPDDTTCGPGCECDGMGPHETLCMDTIDNDDDGLPDCRDDDCPGCMGGVMCCPDGRCAAVC